MLISSGNSMRPRLGWKARDRMAEQGFGKQNRAIGCLITVSCHSLRAVSSHCDHEAPPPASLTTPSRAPAPRACRFGRWAKQARPARKSAQRGPSLCNAVKPAADSSKT